jgi:beta-galactosidase
VAVGLDADGAEVARATLTTAGPPAAIRLTVDREQLTADGQDLAYATVEVVDEHGTRCPDAGSLLSFEISGPASLAAVANANPKSVESFQQPTRTAWRGRALAIARAGQEPGEATLSVTGAGLEKAIVTLMVGRVDGA